MAGATLAVAGLVIGGAFVATRDQGSSFVMSNDDGPGGVPSASALITTSTSPSSAEPSSSSGGVKVQAMTLAPAAIPSQPHLSSAPDPVLPRAHDATVSRLQEWDTDDAQCAVFVHGHSPAVTVRLMGGDPAKHVAASADPAASDSNFVAGVGVRNGWTVLSGWNGYSCADPDILKKLSSDGATAVTVYWNSDIATEQLSYYVDGRDITTWDVADEWTDGSKPQGLDKVKHRLAADVDERPNAALMAMASSITRVVLPYNWKPAFFVRVAQ